MAKRIVRGLGLAACTALVTMVWVSAAAAQVSLITACGKLDVFGKPYKVANDLHACGDCLVVANNRISIDLQGHSIVHKCVATDPPSPPAAAGITDGGIPRNGVVIFNGTISDFVFGIDLEASTRIEVRRVIVKGSDLDGIVVGASTLVKSCQSLANGGDGIRGLKGFIQIQECATSGNDANGIHVGNGCLITANVANENLEEGIATGGRCTVTHNVASSNADGGIDVGHDDEFNGSGSLVTANTTDDNFDDGIHVRCPSTVTNNLASGNAIDFDLEGTNCFAKNNH